MELQQIIPFKVDISGDFFVSDQLLEAREQYKRGELSFFDLGEMENEEIIDVVSVQRKMGLKIVTDGGFRCLCKHYDFYWGLDGIEMQEFKYGHRFNAPEVPSETLMLTSKINFSYYHPLMQHFQFLKSIAGEATPKQIIPSPAQLMLELLKKENIENTRDFYSEINDLVNDIAKAYLLLMDAFRGIDCQYFQLDDASNCLLNAEDFDKIEQIFGVNSNFIKQQAINLIDRVVRNRPSGLFMSLNIYGKQEDLSFLDELLLKVPADLFCLSFEILENNLILKNFISAEKSLAVTLPVSDNGNTEKIERIKTVMDDVQRRVSSERLKMHLQCEFASIKGDKEAKNKQWEIIKPYLNIAYNMWQTM